ncbi:MAG: cyclic nucleotide-binding domain-containing protein [Bryobacteraceae bacterium]
MGTIAQGMGQHTPLEILRAHRFTQGLADTQLSALAALARPVRFEADEIVLSDGQRSSDFYLLISGSVAVELCAPQFTVCVQSLGPGDAFGWSALLAEHDTVFKVRSRERTEALRLSGPALQELCRRDPVLGVEFLTRTLGVVAGRVKATELRFAEMCGFRV